MGFEVAIREGTTGIMGSWKVDVGGEEGELEAVADGDVAGIAEEEESGCGRTGISGTAPGLSCSLPFGAGS